MRFTFKLYQFHFQESAVLQIESQMSLIKSGSDGARLGVSHLREEMDGAAAGRRAMAFAVHSCPLQHLSQ